MQLNKLVIIAVTAAVMFGSGCMSKRDGAGMASFASADAGSIGGLAGFKQTVYAFARTNCAGCHGGPQVPTFAVSDVNAAYKVALPLVNFTEIPASMYVKKVSDGHCGGACNTDGSAMIKLITQWKAAFSVAAPTGATVLLGNIFTNQVTIPAPKPGSCRLPGDLAIGPDLAGNTCWTTLRFPVPQMTPALPAELSRAWFEVDFAYEAYTSSLGVASYVLRNWRVVSPDVPIYVHDIKLFINGVYQPDYAEAYRQVDSIVDAAHFPGCAFQPPAYPTPFDPGAVGSCVTTAPPLWGASASAGGIIQVRDPSVGPADTFAFSFEYFQKGILGDCKDLTMFSNLVYAPIKDHQVACLGCHTSSNASPLITEAGMRFNMDLEDPSNGGPTTAANYDANAGMQNVCRKFLQRVNFALPSASAIITQPEQGTNGMPKQDFFDLYKPDWLTWIAREQSLSQ